MAKAHTSNAVVYVGADAGVGIEELPTPEPEPGACLVAVTHAGICGTDLHVLSGHMKIDHPVVLGHEAVGVVERIGGDEGLRDSLGQTLAPGDRIAWANSVPCGACFACLVDQQPTLCTGERRIYGLNRRADQWPRLSGGWAQRIYLEPGTVTVKLPDAVSGLEAIALGCAGPTAVHGLLHQVPISAGESVAVLGSGPVGMAAALIAKLSGASTVVLIGGPAERLAVARKHGVADIQLDIDQGTHQSRVQAVKALSASGQGVDVVVECAGVPVAVAQALDYVRPNGRVCVLGQYTDHGPTPINPYLLTSKQIHLIGSKGFSGRHFIEFIALLPDLTKLCDLASLATCFDLEDVDTALDAARHGRVVKAVLTSQSDRSPGPRPTTEQGEFVD